MNDSRFSHLSHPPHDAPDLQVVELATPSSTATPRRPKTLRPADHRKLVDPKEYRMLCRTLVHGWWCSAVALTPRGYAGVAESLGVHHSLVQQWARGDAPVQLGDVLAAGPAIAVPVLDRAFARFNGATPRWDGTMQTLLANLHAGITQMAIVLDQSNEDDLSEEQLRELQKLNADSRRKLDQADAKIDAALDRKRVGKEMGR